MNTARPARLRVLFVGRSVYHFTYYESVLRSIVASGHELHLRFDETWSQGQSTLALDTFLRQDTEVAWAWAKHRDDAWRQLLLGAGELRNYGSYLRRQGQSDYYRERWRKYLPPVVRRFDDRFWGRWVLQLGLTDKLLSTVDRAAPAAAAVRDDIAALRPDVLLASPANMRFAEEPEYLRAAKSLGVPTAVLVLSWDNLSTKGLIGGRPDLLLAWNQAHRDAAVEIHGFRPDQVLPIGAPFFDKWFDDPADEEDRGPFKERVGLTAGRPFVLYLGSSRNIARNEAWLVEELLGELDASATLRGASILIRPHPANPGPFSELAARHPERISVWPRDGALPENADLIRDFRESVQHSVGVVGLNTSAMIDTLILDRPCIAILPERYAATQSRAQHFQHLLASGALITTPDARMCVTQLELLADGADPNADQRREAVRQFIRPHGPGVRAGSLAAAAIEHLGRGVPATEVAARAARLLSEPTPVE